MTHLTSEQIERYASRSGDVDEILAVAQHFEVCDDCRDRAAALVDPGDETIGRRRRRISGPRAVFEGPVTALQRLAIWIVIAVLVIGGAIVLLVLRS